jgi:hypothetical protein
MLVFNNLKRIIMWSSVRTLWIGASERVVKTPCQGAQCLRSSDALALQLYNAMVAAS